MSYLLRFISEEIGNAAKPDEEKHGDEFSLRAPTGLKGRAVRASRKRNMKLSPWLIEAIEEKCKREGE